MLTFVIRRLLYSVVVLLAASFIIFTFVSVSGDPVAFLRMQPTASEITIQRIEERKHLNDPIPVQYVYWLKDMLTNKFGTTKTADRPALTAPSTPRHHPPVDGAPAPARHRRRAPRHPRRRRYRRLLGLTPVQRLRL